MRQRKRTPVEMLASDLLNRLGIPARCQVVIGRRYIADFMGYDRAFVLELDGAVHTKQRAYDAKRDQLFRSAGFTVVRIPNAEVSFESLETLLCLPLLPRQKINSMIWYAKLLSKHPASSWQRLALQPQ